MKIACLFGRHWPVAAFHPAQDGRQTSICADCNVGMEKPAGETWRRSASRSSNVSRFDRGFAVQRKA
jgi:hypothetical protein